MYHVPRTSVPNSSILVMLPYHNTTSSSFYSCHGSLTSLRVIQPFRKWYLLFAVLEEPVLLAYSDSSFWYVIAYQLSSSSLAVALYFSQPISCDGIGIGQTISTYHLSNKSSSIFLQSPDKIRSKWPTVSRSDRNSVVFVARSVHKLQQMSPLWSKCWYKINQICAPQPRLQTYKDSRMKLARKKQFLAIRL